MFLTVDNLKAAFGDEELLQIAGLGARDGRVLDEVRLAEAIAAADGIVAGYIRPRYPTLPVTPMLTGCAADIARWRLRGRGGQQTAMTDVVQRRYDAALAMLRDISSGKLALDADGSGVLTQAPQQFTVTSDPQVSPVPGLLEGYR